MTNYTSIYTVFSLGLAFASKYAILARFCNPLIIKHLLFSGAAEPSVRLLLRRDICPIALQNMPNRVAKHAQPRRDWACIEARKVPFRKSIRLSLPSKRSFSFPRSLFRPFFRHNLLTKFLHKPKVLSLLLSLSLEISDEP